MIGGYKMDLHEALLIVAEYNIDYLSYEGQIKWNELAQKEESKILKKKGKDKNK
jgi:hypothetical protein